MTRQVDALFASWDHTDTPGCALGVIKDGQFIYRRGYGMADLEHSISLTGESVFYVASASKQFTATAVILLAERGRLSLDDDIRRYVAELPDYGHTITVRHLLHHTSGLRDYLELWPLAGERYEDVHTADETLQLIARQRSLNFAPGEDYLYSNTGYFLLGVIVGRVSGQTLRKFADQNIFRSLGMESSHFHDDRSHIVPRRARSYFRRPDGRLAVYLHNFALVGDGGLYTSVEDLLLWDRNFYEDKLGNGLLLPELQRRGVLNNGDTLTYAAGLISDRYRGLRTVSHAGHFLNYKSELLRFPDQRFSVICLCNLGHLAPATLARQVADIYLAEQLSDPKTPPVAASSVRLAPEHLKRWAGTYWDPETRVIRELVSRDGGLVADFGGRNIRFEPLSPRRFRAVDPVFEMDIEFEAGIDGESSLLHRYLRGRKPLTLQAVELAVPKPSELDAYAGQYYSDELDVVYRIEFDSNGELYLRGRNLPPGPLTPTVRDEFAVSDIVIHFVRDGTGRVTGLLAGNPWARDIEFERIQQARIDRPNGDRP